MSTRTSLWLLLCSAILMACFPQPPDYTGGGPGTPDANTGQCTLQSAPGKTGGFPYDVDAFKQMVLPPLRSGCLVSPGCHGPGTATRFTVYPSEGSTSTCPDEQSFNEVFEFSDYTKAGAESVIVTKTNGTVGHAFSADTPASMEVTMLLESYIDAAKTAFETGGGGGGGEPFDPATFASQIQPILDDKNCIQFCHNASSSSPSGGFGLNPDAAAGSAEVEANRTAVIDRISTTLSPDDAAEAEFYLRATDTHSGNPITDAADLEALRSWIASGLGQ